MEEKRPWYETEEDRLYEEAVKAIKSAVEGGAAFDEAASKIALKDKAAKADAVEDALKVLIAEMHFVGKTPIEEVAKKLKLPLQRVERAKREMLGEVEAAAIEKYKESLNSRSASADPPGRKGNA